MSLETHQLRCTECGARIAGSAVNSIFRCPNCNGLYDVVYPWSAGMDSDAAIAASNVPNASALRWLWQERRSSTLAIDQSGVWRYRDLFPILGNLDNVVTPARGQHSALRAAALRQGGRPGVAAGQAPGHESHRLLQGYRHDRRALGRAGARLRVGCLRFDRQYFGGDGRLRSSRRAAVDRVIPEGKIAWGKLSQSMDYGALTIQLKTDFDGCVNILTELVKRFPIYLLNSVNPYRAEGQKTPAVEIVEQLDWQVPEHIIVPGGNLANSAALGKGFIEMHQLGLISHVPR